MQRLFWLFLLAGCPAPNRYVVADVTAAHAPVQGALVTAACGDGLESAIRTDEDGRARLPIRRDAACSLVVAKPGFPTVETGLVNACPSTTACAPMIIDFTQPPYDARYARPAAAPKPSGPRPIEVAQ